MKKLLLFACLSVGLFPLPARAVDMYITPKIALGLGSTQTNKTTTYTTGQGTGFGLDWGWELNEEHSQAMELAYSSVSANTQLETNGNTTSGKILFNSIGGAWVYRHDLTEKLKGRLRVGYGNFTETTTVGSVSSSDSGMAFFTGLGANFQANLWGSPTTYQLEVENSGFGPKRGMALFLGATFGF